MRSAAAARSPYTFAPIILIPVLAVAAPAPGFSEPVLDAPWRAFDTGDFPTFGPNSIAMGDVDGDGDPDAVVGREMFSGPGISVLLNNADGTFAAEVVYALGFMQSVGDVALADVDLDDDLDAVATVPDANGRTNAIVLWRNDGHGVFGAPEPFAAGPGPVGLVVADFTGDSFPDVLTADLGYVAGSNNTISLMRHNGLAGPAAGFLGPVSFPVGDDCTQVAAADLDGDQDLDVAVGRGSYTSTNDHGLSVLMNDGTGTFGPPTHYEQMPGAYRFSPAVALADLDNDNDQDLIGAAATNDFSSYGYVWIRRNDGSGNFGPPELHQLQEWTYTPRGLHVAHLDDDGYLDILATTPSGRAMDGYNVLLSNGQGGFRPSPVRYEAGKQSFDITTYDKDGDGDLDVVTVANDSSVLTVHENLGDGSFPVLPRYPTDNGWFSDDMESGDIDNDNDIDIVTSDYDIRIFRNTGEGTFAPVEVYDPPFDPHDIKLRDLNNDGHLDLLMGPDPNSPPYHFAVALNDREGGFEPGVITFVNACQGGQINAVDLDNDDFLDVVLTDYACDVIYLARNSGNGTTYTLMPWLESPGTWEIDAADFDHDQNMDLVTSTALGLTIYPGRGDFTFGDPLPASEAAFKFVVTDLDLDGNEDLGVLLPQPSFGTVEIAVMRGYGDGSFSFATVYPGPNGREGAFRISNDLNVGDVNNDGLPDLVSTNNAPNDLSVFLGNGDGTLRSHDRYGAGYSPAYSAIADFDGDERTDVATLVGSGPSGFNDAVVVLTGHVGDPTSTVQPDSFNVAFGQYRSGGVQDLFESDDAYVVIEQRPAFTPLLPLIRLGVEGIASGDPVSTMVVAVETAATSIPGLPPQKLLLRNYQLNAWELVDERPATSGDNLIEVTIATSPDRFIEPGTNRMQMRLEWFDPGNVIFPAWVTRTDLAVWMLTP